MSLNKSVTAEVEAKQLKYTLEEIFVAYKTPIYQFIFRYCQDEQLSIDIVQDTFIKFHKYQDRFDETKSSVKTYLFRMAYQLMINRLKKRERMKNYFLFYIKKSKQMNTPMKKNLTLNQPSNN